MKGTVLYGPRDVRFEERPEPKILKPTDAIVRLAVSRSRTNEISTSSRPKFVGEASVSVRFSCLARSYASTSIE